MIDCNKTINKLDLDIFRLPLVQKENDYFPSFVKGRLKRFLVDYEDIISPVLFGDNFISTHDDEFIKNILKSISNSLNKSINNYYQGNIQDSYLEFEKAIESSYFENIKPVTEIEIGTSYFRTRIDNERHYSLKDMFHVGFENRHLIRTNRYSISGLPALYLGDSTFVCWSEFNKRQIDKMWFSRFENTKELKIIAIQRFEDLIEETKNLEEQKKRARILRYIVLFPIVIACSVKVQRETASFKPEYIISQFLMQYVSTKDDIDGVKYFSTKVDYSKIKNVPAYNYVFPVKSAKKDGYCKHLNENFHLSEPTSIELENTLFNPEYAGAIFLDNDDYMPSKSIALIENDFRDYYKTSFGRIELKLRKENIPVKKLEE